MYIIIHNYVYVILFICIYTYLYFIFPIKSSYLLAEKNQSTHGLRTWKASWEMHRHPAGGETRR